MTDMNGEDNRMDPQHIEDTWAKLTRLASYTGETSEEADLCVISFEQLVQIMHRLPPVRLCNTEHPADPSAAAIRIASQFYGLDDQDVIGQSRRSRVSFARKMACLLMRDIGKMSFDSIGHALDRDHTTIIYLVKSAQESINERGVAKAAYLVMRQALKNFLDKVKRRGSEEEVEAQEG